MAFDAAAFISTIPQHYNNQRLTTEEWQALYDLYYKPTKVNILQLLTLLQIEAAEAEFMRNLIIYLWETSRSVFISAANNNKHRLKIQQAMTQYAQGESDSVQSVQAIAVQLNFMPKATVTSVAAVATEAKVNNVVSMPAHKPFHVAFAEEVMLPIPETPETQREIPTDKYVQRAERRFIEKQTEAYVQSSAFSSLMAAIQPITEKFKTGSNLIAKKLTDGFNTLMKRFRFKKDKSLVVVSPPKEGSPLVVTSPPKDNSPFVVDSPVKDDDIMRSPEKGSTVHIQDESTSSVLGFEKNTAENSAEPPASPGSTRKVIVRLHHKKSQESVFAVVPEARLKQLNRELFPSARPSQTTVEESRVEEIKDEPIEEVVKKSASKPSYIVTSPVHCSQQAKEPEYIIQSPGICSP